jgi:hypothetical protein
MYGWMIRLGTLDNRPITMSVSFVKLDGKIVMFWYQCSQVTDSVLAEKWIEDHFKGKWDNGHRDATTNADNFHHCVHAIQGRG